MTRKGTLTALEPIPKRSYTEFSVQCDCGNVFTSFPSRWNTYKGKGCGKCYRTRAFAGKNNPKYRHGGTLEHRFEMNSYRGMLMRCYKPNYRAYHRYGGRGIGVCDRWLGDDGFSNFIKDMGKKPTRKHSIDRIDNDKGYSPDNCRWASQTDQMRNTTRSVYYEVEGNRGTMQELSEIYNINPGTVISRIHQHGWPVEKAFMVKSKGVGSNQSTYK